MSEQGFRPPSLVLATVALSLATFLRVLGGSFASSLTTWIWHRREIFHHAQLTEDITAYSPATQSYIESLGGNNQSTMAQLDRLVEGQAYMLSTVDYFTLLGSFSPLSWSSGWRNRRSVRRAAAEGRAFLPSW